MRWPLVVGLVGCGFTPGVLGTDAADVGDAALGDALDATCYPRWFEHTIRFGTPVAMTELSSDEFDRDPFVSADEKFVWFSSGRPGGMGAAVWIAQRAALGDVFGMPSVFAAFDSADTETKLSITQDDLFAVVGSVRAGSAGVDVWESSRATPGDTWAMPTRDHMSQVNTAGSDHDPTISANGLRLYLAPSEPSPQHIAVATRADRTASFSTPMPLGELASPEGDADPSPSPDERIILFGSNRPGDVSGPAAPNVWYATRASSGDMFSAPRIVPDINTAAPEGDPHLSADGCRIYFARNVGTASYDLFVATALP